jgi:hypothetical protein
MAAAWLLEPQLAARRRLQRPGAGQRASTTRRRGDRRNSSVLPGQFSGFELELELFLAALHLHIERFAHPTLIHGHLHF